LGEVGGFDSSGAPVELMVDSPVAVLEQTAEADSLAAARERQKLADKPVLLVRADRCQAGLVGEPASLVAGQRPAVRPDSSVVD